MEDDYNYEEDDELALLDAEGDEAFSPEELSPNDQNNPWREVAIRAENEKQFLEQEVYKLQKEVRRLTTELNKLKAPPLITGNIIDILTDGRVVVKSSTGPNFLVYVASFVNRDKLEVGTRVSLNRDSLAVIGILPKSKDPIVSGAEVIEKPTISFDDIGGLEEQIVEIKEMVELPLVKPELFEKVGIDPPSGVLLVGAPGTGKTMLAQAVARSTNATFIRLVGSELIQKYIGEGGRLVRELFQLAKEKAPSIIFIDELDAVAAKRLDTATSADREVQRTLMQLLSELDGFNSRGNVRIIGASNRPDILDEALKRPGRFDRIITVPLPNAEMRSDIFKIHAAKMSLAKDVNLENIVQKTDGLSGAQIKAICTEAGMFAIRSESEQVTQLNFTMALEKVINFQETDQTASGVMFV